MDANALQVHDIHQRQIPRFTNNGGVVSDTVVDFMVGEHGPYTLRYNGADPGAEKIRADIAHRVQDLRALLSSY
jgi:hypothetical protein